MLNTRGAAVRKKNGKVELGDAEGALLNKHLDVSVLRVGSLSSNIPSVY